MRESRVFLQVEAVRGVKLDCLLIWRANLFLNILLKFQFLSLLGAAQISVQSCLLLSWHRFSPALGILSHAQALSWLTCRSAHPLPSEGQESDRRDANTHILSFT